MNTKDCSTALRHGALDGLYKGFLLNPTLLDEFNSIKQTIFVTLADCFCELFELCDKETRDYYAKEAKEKQAIRQRQQHYSSHSHSHHRKQRGLTTMLLVLIYLSHYSHSFCDMFIKSAAGKSFIEFLDNTADLPTSWFPLYAKLVYELARVEPVAVYQQIIQEKNQKLTVDSIWAILEKTASIYVPKKITRPVQRFMNENLNTSNAFQSFIQQQQQQSFNMMNGMGQTEIVWEEPPEMLDTEIRIVCSVLMVLESLGSIEDVQQTLDFANRPPGIISLLFRLLQCTVPTKVRAHTIACISSFIQTSPSQADRVWDMLERDQILYTQRQTHQPITKVCYYKILFLFI